MCASLKGEQNCSYTKMKEFLCSSTSTCRKKEVWLLILAIQLYALLPHRWEMQDVILLRFAYILCKFKTALNTQEAAVWIWGYKGNPYRPFGMSADTCSKVEEEFSVFEGNEMNTRVWFCEPILITLAHVFKLSCFSLRVSYIKGM